VVSSVTDTQPGTSSAGARDVTRHKFRLLSSLFSFDRRAPGAKRRSSAADTPVTATPAATAAAAAASRDDADATLARGPQRLLISLGLSDTGIK